MELAFQGARMDRMRFAWLVVVLFSELAFGLRAASLDSIFAGLADAKSPGIAVSVRKGGRTIFEAGYGVRDLKAFEKIDARTNFRLASCTKQFTAMAIMLLVHAGKLSYDTRLTDVFPDFPEYGRAITVRHLLTHTSGLADYEDLMGNRWTATHQVPDAEVLRLLERAQPKFTPGTSWAYSNSAYVVLGLIVARVSGLTFPRFLHERIFGPLHMNGTVAYVAGQNVVDRRAFGHIKEGNRFVESDQSPTSATLGDGGVYSNLKDLAKWDDSLQHGTLLSPAEMQVAIQPVHLSDGSEPHWPETPGDDNLDPGKPVAYGFGWFLDSYRNHPRMWHSGSTMGFRTAIERFTRDQLTVIVLCNRADLNPGRLSLQVADELLEYQPKN